MSSPSFSDYFKKCISTFVGYDTAEIYSLIVENWKSFKDYFNVHNLANKKISTSIEKAFEHLPPSPNLEEYKVVYSYYSKFDHFSLMPFILAKSNFQRLGIMIMAVHLIKHAFCAMVSIHFPNHASEFQKIFRTQMIKNNDGSISFKNTES